MIIIMMILIITIVILFKKFVGHRINIIEYNVNYPPYINVVKITQYSHKREMVMKINKLIKRHAKKLRVEYIPMDDILSRSLKYTSSRKFYNDVMIKKRYKTILQTTLNIRIVKSELPLDSKILSVGYLENDRLDTILYKTLMKIKLTYGIDHSIRDIKKIIDISELDVGCMTYNTFNEFINHDKVRDIMRSAFGFIFINH